MTAFNPIPALSQELGLQSKTVSAVVRMLDEGNTIPFVARYRKEATGGLDEVQLRSIQERYQYLQELEQRRETVLSSIEQQGKLTDPLRQQINACTTKSALEDLYLPYKPKRRTRATIAKEKGLEPLAERILAQPHTGTPEAEAAAFVDPEKGVDDDAAALAGARDIIAERLAEQANIRAFARELYNSEGAFAAEPAPGASDKPTKFEQYYAFREAVASIPSHRYLAIRRGEREKVLRVSVDVDEQKLLEGVRARSGHTPQSPFAGQLEAAIQDSVQRLLRPSIETDVRVDAKMRADTAAVEVFARNLRDLLLAAPLGEHPVIGIDPGLRTGCKCAVVDPTGRFVQHVTLYLQGSEKKLQEARAQLLALVANHTPFAIAVGNGTGGRETETFVRTTLREAGHDNVVVVSVNESGASVYSASEIARAEFPDLDLTIRGAISIARRLQDPLAELVKIDPKSIGVGQYQHDVHQPLLQRKLDEVVESCVNHVGVNLNTASAPLLARVAGIGEGLAKRLVEHRNAHGAFQNRQQLLEVSGLGPKTFEQAAGFLRIRDGQNPLDASAVHPERYGLIDRIAADLGVDVAQLLGDAAAAERIDIPYYAAAFADAGVGEPTLRDIVSELAKPGRDPRASFAPPRFREDVNTLEDLQTGMELEGVVTNVTNFGAFVDIGVHQDGLVHVSALAQRFVKDPTQVVRPGDKLKVWVLNVDTERKRISLSAVGPDPQAAQKARKKTSQNRRRAGSNEGETTADAAPRGGGRKERSDNRADAPRTAGGNKAASEAKRSRAKGKDKGKDKIKESQGGKRGDKPQKSKPPKNRFTNNPFAELLDKQRGG